MTELLQLYIDCNYSICTDTRKITPNCLYIALKGDNFNGNEFAQEALTKGAKHAIVDEERFGNKENITLVNNGLEALQKLANNYRKTFEIPVLGITGSNGKTTAKELIHLVLSKKFKTHSTPGNFNNHIGLPLTILSAPKSSEFLILEMGDNHPGEIKLLSEIGDPTFGIVTNVGKDHIEGFGSFENNKLAKKELFDYLEINIGTAFIPLFEEELDGMSSNIKNRIFFGRKDGFCHVEHSKSTPFLHYNNELGQEVKTNLIGDYNIKNIEMAWAIGKYFKVDSYLIDQAISEYEPANNRSQFIEKGNHKIFLDAYNANPSSIALALESFDNQNLSTSRVVILGDMLELGEESLNEHQEVVDYLSEKEFKVFLVGEEFLKTTRPNSFNCFSHRNNLIEFFRKAPLMDSQILIKGSRGIRLEEVLDHL